MRDALLGLVEHKTDVTFMGIGALHQGTICPSQSCACIIVLMCAHCHCGVPDSDSESLLVV